MHVSLWIAQAVLATVFAMSGLVKAVRPKEELAATYPWMRDVPAAAVLFIGIVELLGAIGLIVPGATGIASVLTPVASTGLAVLTGIAAALHIRRGEYSSVLVTAVLFVLAVLVAWGRFGPHGW